MCDSHHNFDHLQANHQDMAGLELTCERQSPEHGYALHELTSETPVFEANEQGIILSTKGISN